MFCALAHTKGRCDDALYVRFVDSLRDSVGTRVAMVRFSLITS